MQISKIANLSFGRFIDYNIWDNVILSSKDVEILDKTFKYIDKTEGQNIDVFARIGTPNEPEKLYVKFKTIPLHEDFETIQTTNYSAKREDYKRHSKWLPLDKTLLYNALEYLHAQNGYIHYCVKHPDHNNKPKEGYGKPSFDINS